VIPLRDANPTRRQPIITPALIAACFVAFAYELFLLTTGGDAAVEGLARTWGLVPVPLVDALKAGNWFSQPVAALLTHQFLHGGWAHILGNMLFLWIFGGRVEDRIGRVRFLLFYLVGGVAAGVGQVLSNPSSTDPMIGASGAISAVLGAYLVAYPRARIQSLVFLGFFYQLLAVPAALLLVYWFGLQVIDGIAALGQTDLTGGVAVYAHIGGFIAGALMALPLRLRAGLRPRPRPSVG
jgi:membrane associated rhomboid family serine protease